MIRRLIPLLMLLLGGLYVAPAQAQTSNDCAFDLVMLVDTSASMTPEDFDYLRAFAGSLASALPLNDVRVALAGFSTEAGIATGFTSDAGTLSGSANGLALQGDASDFTVALNTGQEIITGGARPYVPRGIILITDGLSRVDALDIAGRIRGQGTLIFTVGVGRAVARRELFNIASRQSLAFFSDTFDTLPSRIPNIVSTICSAALRVGGRVQARIKNENGYMISLPAEGVTVTLYDGNTDTPIRSVVTDVYGRYSFAVAPGRYDVHIELPPGAEFVPPYDGVLPNAGMSYDGRFFGTNSLFTLIRTPALDRS